MGSPGRPSEQFPVLRPDLQIAFYNRLQTIRSLYLHEALQQTVSELDVSQIDHELATFVDKEHLARVASFGIRGEVFFPVPYVIRAYPSLLGYYRLLFGISQKEFYGTGKFGRFRTLEQDNLLPKQLVAQIDFLCRSLVTTGQLLIGGLERLSLQTIHELQLLTLGPQLRGAQGTLIGQIATAEVATLIESIARDHLKYQLGTNLIIENAAGREVLIEFANDPDVRVTEKLLSGSRPIVSMEVKGGADVSNIHNRLGEAEKSHLKARDRGFFEFWTILRANVDLRIARRESPTTTQFFNLARLLNPRTEEHRRFRELLSSMLGIKLRGK
jgi:hypothetical protein